MKNELRHTKNPPSRNCLNARRLLITGLMMMIATGPGVGCAPDTTPGSRIATTRVLGTRIVAGGDPARVWPRPGETATLTWIVAGPTIRPLAWSFGMVACTEDQDDTTCRKVGAPVAPLAPDTGSGTTDGSTAPVLSVSIPESPSGVPTVDRLLVDGVICAGGAVADRNAAPWSRCAATATDGSSPVGETAVQATILVQTGEAGNAPPTVGNDPITWEGTEWLVTVAGSPMDLTDLTDAGQPCRDRGTAGITIALDDAEHEVEVIADAEDRESFAAMPSDTFATREGLQISAFTTLGSFDSQFAAVLAADVAPTTALSFKWTPPSVTDAALPPDGRLVRFVFVLRDGRGGLDFTSRSLCLLPPGIHDVRDVARRGVALSTARFHRNNLAPHAPPHQTKVNPCLRLMLSISRRASLPSLISALAGSCGS